MGSFSSTPKILNGDTQDNDVHVPEGISRQELIQYCQKQQRHPLIKRAFRKAFDSKDSMTYALKFKKLNSVSKGNFSFKLFYNKNIKTFINSTIFTLGSRM